MNEIESLKSQLREEIKRREQQGEAAERLKAEHKKQLGKVLKACESVTNQYLSALAAIEKHNKDLERCSIAPFGRPIAFDLSLLHEHVRKEQKPADGFT